MHTIRLALADDYPAICEYLEAHWRKGHIFTKSKALFDWQHWDAARQRYNFILGCAPNGDVQGVLGFIPHGQFDPALGFDSIWLCIWHASVKGTGLGRRLLDWLEETFKPTFLATNGASEMSLPLYRARGWETGKLEHWYMHTHSASRGVPEWFETSEDEHRKSLDYMLNRYHHHPFYGYDIEGNTVVRRCVGATTVLRVVDFMSADELSGHDWRDLAQQNNAQFVDCYCAGVDAGAMMRAGFQRRIGDEVVVPCHFEPFEFKNIDVNYAVKAPKGMMWRVVRGDGDGDRPNILP